MRRRKLILLPFLVLIAVFFGLQLLHLGSLDYAQLTGTVIPLTALGFVATDITLNKKERERTERRIIPPVKQLKYLSDEYGLPVITPLQKSKPLPHGATAWLYEPHRCGGMYYQNAKLCPVHGDQATAEKEPEYVPEGQADLSAALLEYVKDQVADARTTQWTAGRKREWRVGPEWLDEISKLKDTTGAPLWIPRHRVIDDGDRYYLFGYPVVVADHFGVPELTAVLK